MDITSFEPSLHSYQNKELEKTYFVQTRNFKFTFFNFKSDILSTILQVNGQIESEFLEIEEVNFFIENTDCLQVQIEKVYNKNIYVFNVVFETRKLQASCSLLVTIKTLGSNEIVEQIEIPNKYITADLNDEFSFEDTNTKYCHSHCSLNSADESLILQDENISLVDSFDEYPSLDFLLGYFERNKQNLKQLKINETHFWKDYSTFNPTESSSIYSYTHKSIVLIVSELTGPTSESVGSLFYQRLSEMLVRQGHRVTILLVLRPNQKAKIGISEVYWKSYYKKRGIDLLFLERMSLMLEGHLSVQYSYEVYLWLLQNHFDIINFDVCGGLAYYTTLAKKLKLNFENSTIYVRAENISEIESARVNHLPYSQEDLEIRFMEKQSAETADCLFSNSAGIFEYLNALGWNLPKNSFYMQHIGANISPIAKTDNDKLCLVMNPFLDADLKDILESILKLDNLNLKKLVVLTSEIEVNQSLFKRIIESAFLKGIPIQILHGLSPVQMLTEIITQKSRVVFSPSEINSSYLIEEVKKINIPHLIITGAKTFQLGGDSNVIKSDLKNSISKLLLSEFGYNNQTDKILNQEDYWNQFYLQQFSNRKDTSTQLMPLVSVCIPIYNRVEFLDQALESIQNQSYSNIEVIICDDGSNSDDIKQQLNNFQKKYKNLNIRLLFQENKGPGAARNHAAANARGRYLFFLDDDNLLMKESISKLVQIAEAENLDIVTSSLSLFQGKDRPEKAFAQMLFLGSCTSAGYLRNVFGDTFALHKRKTFIEIGGFDVNRNASHEDWEIYARALLYGYKLEHIPLSLGWYRSSQTSHFHRSNGFYSQLQSLSPFKRMLSRSVSTILEFSQNLQNLRVWRSWFSVSLMDADQSFLERRFLYSDEVIYKLSCSDEFVETHNCSLEGELPNLSIEAHTVDPQLILPEINFNRLFRLIVEIEISCSIDTSVQLFFITNEEDHYSEYRTCIKNIKKGRQKIYVPYIGNMLRDKIRFDPGFYSGTYILHSFEIREIV